MTRMKRFLRSAPPLLLLACLVGCGPRGLPARTAETLRDYDPRRADWAGNYRLTASDDKAADEVRAACESIRALAAAGRKLDTAVVDALWSFFARFRASRGDNCKLAKALHEAVVAVHDPSWGDKAIEL